MAKFSISEETIKAVIGAFLVIITSALIGMFVWVFNVHADLAVHKEKMTRQEQANIEMIQVVGKNTDALNDFRVVAEGLTKTVEALRDMIKERRNDQN